MAEVTENWKINKILLNILIQFEICLKIYEK